MQSIQFYFGKIFFPVVWLFNLIFSIFKFFKKYRFHIEVNINVYESLNEVETINQELKRKGNLKILRNMK
jgi:hypothetical protein